MTLYTITAYETIVHKADVEAATVADATKIGIDEIAKGLQPNPNRKSLKWKVSPRLGGQKKA